MQLHSPDLEKFKCDEPWEALEILKSDGENVREGWSVQSFKETEQPHILDMQSDLIDKIQVRYNLLERKTEEVLLPKVLEYCTCVIVRILLLFGLLTGKFQRKTKFSPDNHRNMNLSPEKISDYFQLLEKVQIYLGIIPMIVWLPRVCVFVFLILLDIRLFQVQKIQSR